MGREEMRLISAREAASILRIDPSGVYKLWHDEQLDFWCINGTMKTNLDAIRSFQDKNRSENQPAPLEQESLLTGLWNRHIQEESLLD